MDKVKKILIEFTWKGHTIKQFIEQKIVFDDIKGTDAFWGEFIIGTDKFQYQIWWSGEIAIFNNGGNNICAVLDNFNLTFGNNY